MRADAPEQSYKLIRKLIPGFLQPTLRGLRKRFSTNRPLQEPYRTISPYTQVHIERQKNLVRLAMDIDAQNVPGAIIECGVLDGGTAALMAYASAPANRDIHLFDSWQGLPDATEKDDAAGKAWSGDVVGSQGRVRSIMKQFNIDPGRITYHVGWFDQTFPKAQIGHAALIHIDADFYESVKLSIATWYPLLSAGGYMQFDDYSAFIGCKRAVDEFLIEHPELQLHCLSNIVFFLQKP